MERYFGMWYLRVKSKFEEEKRVLRDKIFKYGIRIWYVYIYFRGSLFEDKYIFFECKSYWREVFFGFGGLGLFRFDDIN